MAIKLSINETKKIRPKKITIDLLWPDGDGHADGIVFYIPETEDGRELPTMARPFSDIDPQTLANVYGLLAGDFESKLIEVYGTDAQVI